MPHEFELRKEIELDATPEQVWEAIATGPGVDSWFMGRTEIEPREGGVAQMTMMGSVDQSTVTAWEPSKRFAYRGADGPDGTFMAFEYLIEGRDGGGTVLRLVQSGFLGDDWESEYEALRTGWDMYLHTLAQYLSHFSGQTAKAVVTTARPDAGDPDQVWKALTGALGLSGPVAEGARARLTLDGLSPAEGVVDYAGLPTFLGVRTDDGLYRFIHSGPSRGNVVVLQHHIFSGDLDDQAAEKAWQSWLGRVLV